MKSLKYYTNYYLSKATLPYWTILLLDCLIAALSGLFTFCLHYGLPSTFANFGHLALTLALFLVCFVFAFRVFHTYNGIIRYSSFSDLLRIGGAVLLAMATEALIYLVAPPDRWLLHYNFTDIVLMGLMVIAFMWGMRVWVKTIYEQVSKRSDVNNAYILGVQSGGVAIAKSIRSAADSPYRLAGFVTPDPTMRHVMLMGVKVHLFDGSLPDVMTVNNVTTLIVSPLTMDILRRKENEEVINRLVDAGIKIMVMSQVREWDGKEDIRLADLHPVDVEDLLPREKIEVDMKAAAELIQGNVVMITGAAGSIGSEMVRQIATYRPSRMILIDQAETPMHDVRLEMREKWPDIATETIVATITDRRLMRHIFSRHRPQYVFHAAAYKHVPMMEDNPYEAIINNVDGTRVIADLAVEFGTRKFVMVSTDKAVNPTNVMGCSKRICEIYVQSLDKAIKNGLVKGETQFVTTRFGNVLGSSGSVIPIFQKQIMRGGPVTVTHPDIIRFFMLIPEACRLVIEAGTMGSGGEIYVFDMGEPVRIADLAKRMIRLSGAKDIEIRFTGLRDGEKLYEEVLNDKEITLPTFHPRIKVAKVREYGFAEVSAEIAQLVGSTAGCDGMEIVRRMKKLVPEFRSQHSRYQILDNKE